MPIESFTYTDRAPRPWWKKANLIWLASNPDEPMPPPDYKAGSAQWWRRVAWWLRNPFQGAGNYGFGYSLAYAALAIGGAVYYWHLSPLCILLSLLAAGGLSDRNYTVTGTAPVLSPNADNQPSLYGVRWFVIWWHGLPFPMISYESARVIFYAGWQPTGFFGFKINGKGDGLV